jgi:LPS export ABC transporter protein LptC
VEIRRNVVVTSSDGLRLDTSVLRWDAAQQRLWTDAPVTLSRGASVVRGSGLEVKIDDEATTVSGRVRATFDLSGRR